MKLSEIYDTMVRMGREADPRGDAGVERTLESARKEHEELTERTRWEFDTERLRNPYADTRILYGEPDREIRRILVGVDMEIGELLLADRMREKGQEIDLVVSHHPEGRALADLQDVMGVQADIWHRQGVPLNYGDALMAGRMSEIQRTMHPLNAQRSVDAARLLDIPFMCCHTPSDNCVAAYLQSRIDEELDPKSVTLKELLDFLKAIPEYRAATLQGAGPVIFSGDEGTRAGRIMVDMTGGTSGPKDAVERLGAAGVGTIVAMHMPEEHRKKAEEAHVNVVIAGHQASDSLGMNLILDELEQEGITSIPCSGLIREKRR